MSNLIVMEYEVIEYIENMTPDAGVLVRKLSQLTLHS